MAAFVLIGFSIGVDLYQVGVRCLKSGFSIRNLLNTLREYHHEIRATKYLECIDEIYANPTDKDFHLLGIECFVCRHRFGGGGDNNKMYCNPIETALEVDRCEEAFEIISDVSEFNRIFPIAQN